MTIAKINDYLQRPLARLMGGAVVAAPFDESFARDSINALKAAGWTDAIRYAEGVGKAISLGEAQMYWAAGMSLTLVDEMEAQMGLGGYNRGVQRAIAANKVWDLLGAPRSPNLGIYYATEDPNTRPGTYQSDVAFFQGVRDVHMSNGQRLFGPYGSGPMIDFVLSRVTEASLGWSVRTWGVSSRSTLVQEPNATMDTLNHSIDQNSVGPAAAKTQFWGQWHPTIVYGPPINKPSTNKMKGDNRDSRQRQQRFND